MGVLFSVMVIAGCGKDKIEDPVLPEPSYFMKAFALYQFDSISGYGIDDLIVKAYDNKGTAVKTSDGGYIRYNGNGEFASQGNVAQSILEKTNQLLLYGSSWFLGGVASHDNYQYLPTIKSGKLYIAKFLKEQYNVSNNGVLISPVRGIQKGFYSSDNDVEISSLFTYKNGDIKSLNLISININENVINDNYIGLFFYYGMEAGGKYEFIKNVLLFIKSNRYVSFYNSISTSTRDFIKPVKDWYNNSVLVPVSEDSCAIYNYEGNLLYKIKANFPNQTYCYPINYTEYISVDGANFSRHELGNDHTRWETRTSSIANYPNNSEISNLKILSTNVSVWTFLCTVKYSDNSTKDITLDVDINTGKVTVK
jgi:hypothetical protein